MGAGPLRVKLLPGSWLVVGRDGRQSAGEMMRRGARFPQVVPGRALAPGSYIFWTLSCGTARELAWCPKFAHSARRPKMDGGEQMIPGMLISSPLTKPNSSHQPQATNQGHTGQLVGCLPACPLACRAGINGRGASPTPHHSPGGGRPPTGKLLAPWRGDLRTLPGNGVVPNHSLPSRPPPL